MPKQTIQRWSYSAYSQWAECPAKYAYQRFDRLKPAKSSPALERGTRIHTLGEQYLDGTLSVVPKEYKAVDNLMKSARNVGYVPEENWAVTVNWEPCEWTDWNNNWGMAKTDAHFLFESDGVLSIVDFKTGRIYPKHADQAEVYAVFGGAYYPDEFDKVEIEFWYLDQKGDEILGDSPFVYTAAEVAESRIKWVDKVQRMMSSTRFPHKPSRNSCRFCDFRSDKELAGGAPGPCDEWRDVQ